MTKKILLKYSTEKSDAPVFSSVIRETDVLINILHANVGSSGGELLVSIDAPEKKAEDAIALFRERGVEVEEVKRTIKLDDEACIECGACISLCPTGALQLADDYSLILDEDKCAYCEACVPACPTRALKVSKL